MSTRIGKRAFSLPTPRYAEGAKEALKGQDNKVEIAKSAASVFDYIKTKKVKKLAVPMERVSVPEAAVYKKYKFKLTDSMPAFVEAMSVKTDEEMQNVAAACEIAEKALDKLYGELKEGDTENEVRRAARILYARIRRGRPFLRDHRGVR